MANGGAGHFRAAICTTARSYLADGDRPFYSLRGSGFYILASVLVWESLGRFGRHLSGRERWINTSPIVYHITNSSILC